MLSGPDHLAAVAPLAADADRPQWRAGLQWGLGHTAGVMVIGLLLISVRQALPIEAISQYSERIVGVALLLVGVWALCARPRTQTPQCIRRRERLSPWERCTVSPAAHTSLASCPPWRCRPSLRRLLIWRGFGVGAVLGMTAFSALVGAITIRATRRGVNAYRGVLYACSLSALLVGGFWLIA